jgi:hypothetical protein
MSNGGYMKRREGWDTLVPQLSRVPIDAPVDGHIEGVPTQGEPIVKVGDLVKFIMPDDWEHHAIEVPIFTDEPALGVVRSINWMLISTNKGEYYIPEAEVYWSLTEKITKHTHDSLEVINAVQGG